MTTKPGAHEATRSRKRGVIRREASTMVVLRETAFVKIRVGIRGLTLDRLPPEWTALRTAVATLRSMDERRFAVKSGGRCTCVRRSAMVVSLLFALAAGGCDLGGETLLRG